MLKKGFLLKINYASARLFKHEVCAICASLFVCSATNSIYFFAGLFFEYKISPSARWVVFTASINFTVGKILNSYTIDSKRFAFPKYFSMPADTINAIAIGEIYQAVVCI